MIRTDVFTPSRFTSEGNKLKVHGKEFTYHTVCEDNVFYDEEGKAIASMFTYSYFRDGVKDPDKRPVIFAFNGGPGTSSMMVHVGFVGTIRLKYSKEIDEDGTPLPPYKSCDNEYCLLDVADLVVVDPVGTGFGRLLDESKKDQFLGIEADATSFNTMIQKWLDRYGRWKSPKYLMGESYGCTRAATIVGMSTFGDEHRAYGTGFDGVILIGNTVTNKNHFFDKSPIYPAILSMPTLAAVHWYHNHPTDQGLEEFVYEATEWANTEYLVMLFKGEEMTGREKERVIKKLIHYTGVSREYLEDRNLVIEDEIYRSQVARGKGRAVSRLDGRITRPLYELRTSETKMEHGMWDDPSEGKYDPFFESVLCGDVFKKLNINWDRNFVSSTRFYKDWNNEIKGRNTAQNLSDTMRRVPGMRAFFLNGWYDLCTETGILWYTMKHSNFPKDRIFFKGYEAGHMAYLGEENVKLVCDDVRKFVQGKDPTK